MWLLDPDVSARIKPFNTRMCAHPRIHTCVDVRIYYTQNLWTSDKHRHTLSHAQAKIHMCWWVSSIRKRIKRTAQVHKHADRFLEVLSRVSSRHIQAMKLHRHITDDNAKAENAHRIIFVLQQHPRLQELAVESYVQSPEALQAYEKFHMPTVHLPSI